MGLKASFDGIYTGKSVLVTGHTGFKGSWLSLWLNKLGACVTGYSLEAPTTPNHFDLLNLSNDLFSVIADIRDGENIKRVIKAQSPDIVFHLAAQPLVRASYQNPIETFDTNVMGTAHVLDACRNCESVRAIIIVTSDKCYENKNKKQGYVETETLGGYDPYSASKACAELVTRSYQNAFFSVEDASLPCLIATARAGNVIGGGDWAADRLIPDIVRAIVSKSQLEIRYPQATRPWQHVLESLSGYLLLGQKLLQGESTFSGPWNFGPNDNDDVSVESLLKEFQILWPQLQYAVDSTPAKLHEATLLTLNSTKARARLGWNPVWAIDEALKATGDWYRAYIDTGEILSCNQLVQYVEAAAVHRAPWASVV